MATASTKPEVSLLRVRDVVSRVGLSQPTIYRRIRAGEFPAPISIGPNSVAWPSNVIDSWIEEQIARAAAPGGRQATAACGGVA